MENASEKTEKKCRTCLRPSSIFEPLFGTDDLVTKIEIISSLQVTQTDNLPAIVCAECIININLAFNFRRVLINSDSILKKELSEREVISFESTDVTNLEAFQTELVDIGYLFEDTLDDFAIDKNSLNDQIRPDDLVINCMDTDSVIEDCVDQLKCDKCDFIAKTVQQFKAHKKRGHKVYNKVVCDICGKFVTYANFNKHMTAHTENPVSCDHCGTVCKNAEVLRAHIYRHKIPTKTCQYCGILFKPGANIMDHIRTNHTGQIKNHHCTLCDKSFYKATTLAKHIRSHTGERPYKCKYCKKGLSSSYALKIHVQGHTSERPYWNKTKFS